MVKLTKYLRSKARAFPFLAKVSGALRKMISAEKLGLAEQVASSPYFNADYYAKAASKKFHSDIEAAVHYVTEGEARGLQPSDEFDPAFYRMTNPDLRNLSRPLLLHYTRHGAAEGRRPVLDPMSVIQPGQQAFAAENKTALVSIHEASRTGAPIIGLNLIRLLSQTFNIVVVLLRGGELQERFSNHAWRVVCPALDKQIVLDPVPVLDTALRSIQVESEISVAIVNSSECAAIVPACYDLGIPCVTLIHEFSEYVFPHSKLVDIFTYSNSIVFPSELTKSSALSLLGPAFHRNDLHVFPQGKSVIPDIDSSRSEAGTRELFDAAETSFLCIGCGALQVRKGVDLFVAAAAAAVREIGSTGVRFLWIGDESPGFDSIWLKDQIARSGLSDIFRIVPALGGAELERLYRTADAMFLSSRLDPFPNVAIEAICAGLPLVCFDKASGIAEYIGRVEGLEALVVPYFDPGAAGRVLARLARDTSFKADVSRRLLALAEGLDFHAYVAKLVTLLDRAMDQGRQEREDADLLEQAGILDLKEPAFVSESRKTGRLTARDYVRLSSAGMPNRDPRRPFPGFSPHIYRSEHPQMGKFRNPVADWIRSGRAAGRFNREVLMLSNGPRRPIASEPRLALHLHLHYPELVEDILSRLEINRARADLLVSATSPDSADLLARRLKSYRKGKVEVRLVENRGRDVAPMLVEFASALAGYDLIGHIHGKRSAQLAQQSKAGSDFVRAWRNFLLENLLGDRVPALDILVAEFDRRPDLGLVFPEDPHICGWGDNFREADRLRKKVGLAELPQAIEFPVGNMFIARPRALAPLFGAGVSLDDFPEEPAMSDGTLMHAIERLAPLVCEKAGFRWLTTQVQGISR